ncbi:hypothetical protein [Nostoc sp.]|uniref:hypothetical protein n=1 Tax=Nostoc sp. TaxID=1180 RepID=UPI002FF73687
MILGNVRIDASQSPRTKLNGEEIGRFVKDEVLALIESNVIGKDLVEYVEVIYNDSAEQEQRITFQVQNGNVVI